MRLNSLTNTRPVKDQGCQIIVSPTEGAFKVSDDAAAILSVAKGDYIDIAEHPGERGVFFVGKGAEGTETSKGNGSKIGKSGAWLNFSAAAAWAKLGDPEFNIHMDLSTEPVMVDVDHQDEPVPYYKLIPAGKEAKISRTVGASKPTASATNNAEIEVETEEEVEESLDQL